MPNAVTDNQFIIFIVIFTAWYTQSGGDFFCHIGFFGDNQGFTHVLAPMVDCLNPSMAWRIQSRVH